MEQSTNEKSTLMTTVRSKMKPKKSIIIFIICMLLVVFAILFTCFSHRNESNETTATAEMRSTYTELEYAGEVQPNEIRQIYAVVDKAKVIDVLVNEGDFVHKGDVLVKLDSTDKEFEIKQKELAYEQIKLEAETNLNSAQSQLTAVNDGLTKGSNPDIISKRQQLHNAQSDYDEFVYNWNKNVEAYNNGQLSELVEAQNNLYAAQAALAKAEKSNRDKPDEEKEDTCDYSTAVYNAQRTLESVSASVEGKMTLYMFEFDKVSKALADATADYNAAVANAKHESEILQDRVNLAQNSTNVEQAGLELDKLKTDLNHYTIKAQCDGYISSLEAKPGDVVEGKPLMNILNYESMKVEFDVDEFSILRFKMGTPVRIHVNAVDQDFDGQVIKIASEANKINDVSFIKVTVSFDTEDVISSGLGATVYTVPEDEAEQLFIPSSAIYYDNENENMYVRVVTEDGEEQREIMIGADADGYSSILSGLEEGETVIYKEEENDE